MEACGLYRRLEDSLCRHSEATQEAALLRVAAFAREEYFLLKHGDIKRDAQCGTFSGRPKPPFKHLRPNRRN